MSIDFNLLLTMLLLKTPSAVVLSVCIGLSGCLCPIYSSVVLDGTSSRQLMKSVQSSASAADDMTALMILDIVVTAPLFEGYVVSSVMRKCPPALLRDFASERYDASLCPARTMALAW